MQWPASRQATKGLRMMTPDQSQDIKTASPQWGAWPMAVVALVVTTAVYFRTFIDLWPRWMDAAGTTYTHGILIAGLCLWLGFRARRDLEGIAARPALWALPGVLVLSLAWMVARKGAIADLYNVLWPLLAWMAVLAAAGWPAARRLIVPIGFLYFAIPVWDHGNWILQALTVKAVAVLNSLTGVEAVMAGNLVILPAGRFEIAAGCSGLHFFMVGLAIAVLAGELHGDRLSTRVLLVALAGILAVVSNWLRVYFIVLAGYLTNMQHYLVKVDHYKFGWVVFAVAMVGFFLVLRRLPAGDERPRPDAGSLAPATAGQASRTIVAALVALVALPAVSMAANVVRSDAAATDLTAPALEDFSGPLSATPAWSPRFRGADAEVHVAYLARSGVVLDYYRNAHINQSQGHELISSGNQLFDEADFKVVTRSLRYVDAGTELVPAIELRLEDRSGRTWQAFYHYDVAGSVATGRLSTQLLTGYRSLLGPSAAGVRAVAARCDSECELVVKDLESLLLQTMRNPT